MITCQRPTLYISMSQHCHLPLLMKVRLITSGGSDGRRACGSMYTLCAHPCEVSVCLPSAERGAVGNHVDTQGSPVTWKRHCPCQGTAKTIYTYAEDKDGLHSNIMQL